MRELGDTKCDLAEAAGPSRSNISTIPLQILYMLLPSEVSRDLLTSSLLLLPRSLTLTLPNTVKRNNTRQGHI